MKAPTQPYMRFGGGFLVEVSALAAPSTLERIYVSNKVRNVLVGQKDMSRTLACNSYHLEPTLPGPQ